MIRFKLILAIRNLLKDRLNGVLIIGGFAIGFTACMLIGMYYMSEHRVNKVFGSSENIYRIYDAKKETVNLDFDLYPALSDNFPEIEKACPMEYVGGWATIVKDGELDLNARLTQLIATTESFFDIFSVEVVESLSDQVFAVEKSLVITESVAKQMYGTVSPIGRTLKSDFFEGTITAVIKDLPQNATFKAELIINSGYENFRFSQSCNDGDCWFMSPHFVVLNESVNPDILAQKINHSVKSISTRVDSLAFQSIEDIYLSEIKLKDAHSKGSSKILYVFLGIGILILVLSSINYVNYTISKQFSKLKEFGIKKTNGANAANLFSGALVEVSLGILISFGLAILFTFVLLPYTEYLFGKKILLSNVNISLAAVLFIGTVTVVIFLNSLASVYILSKFNITDFLSGSTARKGKQVGRQVMLTFQLVTSIVLIACVLTIFKQLDYIKHHDLGFDQEQLVRFDLPFNYNSPSTLKEEIGKLPFVAGSALSDGYPGSIKLRMGTGETKNAFTLHCITISDDYIETMGMQLLEGRDFHLGDEDRACYMNREAVKRFGWDSIDDKIYKQGSRDGFEVLGVVEDFNTQSLHSEIQPVALLYRPERNFNTLSVRLAPGNVSQHLEAIEAVWKDLMPHEPMYFTFYDQQFQQLYEKEERLGKAISFFSIVAIVLTCMGILGQILMLSLIRTKEIGIRKVNGAKVSEILAMLNKDFVKWVTIAFIIATPIAWYAMSKWLENFAYKTSLSWWIFALAGVLALGIALLTVSWQSWRAATRNPVEALRYE